MNTSNKDKKVKALIFDWAGTTIDYGCRAPLAVFLELFMDKGIPITFEEASRPMGKLKIEHIAELLQMERIRNEYYKKYGKYPDKNTVDEFYSDFETNLFKILPVYTEPLPGVVDTINILRKDYKLKIGSTTGYTKEMMDIITPIVEKKGYKPDYIISSSEVKQGRPYPWMIYHNAMNLCVFPMEYIVKIGDTIADIEEGRNSGCWTVGIIEGSSTMGMTQEEYSKLNEKEKGKLKKIAEDKYKAANPDFIINSFKDIPQLIDTINNLLNSNQYPGNKISVDSESLNRLSQKLNTL